MIRTLREIATERQVAMMNFDNVSSRNTANLTLDERIDLDVAYAEAKAEYIRLEDEYQAWIRKERK